MIFGFKATVALHDVAAVVIALCRIQKVAKQPSNYSMFDVLTYL
jgi:hypothetical protein